MASASNNQNSDFSPTGTLFINNTSYSGCDIKVVINTYRSGASSKEVSKQVDGEISLANQRIRKHEEELFGITSRLDDAKPGTQEYVNLSKSKSKCEAEIASIENYIQWAQEELASSDKESGASGTKVLAECQTLSISTHRDKQAVRGCGSVYPIGFTRGPRSIAGTMVFTVFHEHVLYRFLDAHVSDFDALKFTSAVLDQIPPVDVTISFANELGSISRMAITGVEFISEGQTMSVEDLITENIVNYVARDWDPMRHVKQIKYDKASRMVNGYQTKKASDLILENDYKEIKNAISPFERFKRRRNPFL